MNIIHKLLYKFYQEEYSKAIIILVICIVINILQTNGISAVTARIINTLKQSGSNNVQYLIWLFVGLSVAYLALHYVFKTNQNHFMTKLRQWMRNQLVQVLLRSNNENFSETNFINFETPINRISTMCFNIVNDVLTFLLPTLVFLIIIAIYFLYNNPVLGLAFIFINVMIVAYLYFIWDMMLEKNDQYEKSVTTNEVYLLEILNNIDKIVYRGQTKDEIQAFDTLSKKAITNAYNFYAYINDNNLVLNSMVYSIMFFFLFYSVYLYKNKQMSLETFITMFSIIILYREKMSVFVQQVPDFIEFIGRTNSVLRYYDDMNVEDFLTDKLYDPVDLPFETIEFRDVTFKYKSHDFTIFDKFNIKLQTTGHKIIGMVGPSGRGKSSFAKLILKMYDCNDGDIFIDGVNTRDIDANYIRKNITYVNQNSKLFDRLIIDNMLYGCSHEETCYAKIDEIIKNYPKIAELFKNIDIYTKNSGPLGEHLSGGQRQIVNIVGGLANPSKILILDEPTNALDSNLKSELLRLIYENRTNKECIIIITHDKDVHGILNEKIAL